jgi:acetate kinase
VKSVLSLNSGSSSIKLGLFAATAGGETRALARGRIEAIGIAPRLVLRDGEGALLHQREWPAEAAADHTVLLDYLLQWIGTNLAGEITAAGHRVVHGGLAFDAPCLVDEAVLESLQALVPVAPLHQPHNLAGIRALQARHPGLPQVACFDTAFHCKQPDVATRLGIPDELHAQGVRRYGFHGLSYEYVLQRLQTLDPALASRRLIVAHLGNGASLCAIDGGRSVDTTMGFSALDGLLMGTRCGTLDPGVVLHLQRELGFDVESVADLLYRRSGLLGVSGLSSDMRTLAASASPGAERAIDLFVWRAVREAGALIASLGGLDGLVFTAGIGENDAALRARICRRLGWLGLELDEQANKMHHPVISAAGSTIKVWIVPTDEERVIAAHTLALVGSTQGTTPGDHR